MLASSDRHSVLIEGPGGSGKTYLVKQYARMVECEDMVVLEPTVAAIRDGVLQCYNLDSKCVLCIENLDTGVPAASYALLKLLEEPQSNIYVAVTCNSMMNVPDTIVSRSACVSTCPPIAHDIEEYASVRDAVKYSTIHRDPIWRIVSSFKDVDVLYKLSDVQKSYIRNLFPIDFRDSVSNIAWRLMHYADNSLTPLDMVIRYIMCSTNNISTKAKCIDCLHDLKQARIGQHAVVSKFVFELKYSE